MSRPEGAEIHRATVASIAAARIAPAQSDAETAIFARNPLAKVPGAGLRLSIMCGSLRWRVARVNRARANRCCRRDKACYLNRMPASPLDRINTAIARIEAATTEKTRATEHLARRHAALRTRMADAITALDQIIAQDEPDE